MIPWIIPVYKKLEAVATAEASNVSRGFVYLTILALILILITAGVILMKGKKVRSA